MPLVVILDGPKISPSSPGGNGPHTLVAAVTTSSCSFKMSSEVVTRSNPALPLVACRGWRFRIFLSPQLLIAVVGAAVVGAPVGVWGTGAHTPVLISLEWWHPYNKWTCIDWPNGCLYDNEGNLLLKVFYFYNDTPSEYVQPCHNCNI